jgi:hypothetical protein
MSVQDPSGMTRERMNDMSLQEQFELYGQRYVHIQELLRDAQLVVSDGPWLWNGVGILPGDGGIWVRPLPGGTYENSYYLDDSRSIQLEGARGAESDLEPMRRYFEAQGWETSVETWGEGDERILSGYTDDGYIVDYGIQISGRYYINAHSEPFWGRADKLTDAISRRIPKFDSPEETPPGEYFPFPKWTDPLNKPWTVDGK